MRCTLNGYLILSTFSSSMTQHFLDWCLPTLHIHVRRTHTCAFPDQLYINQSSISFCRSSINTNRITRLERVSNCSIHQLIWITYLLWFTIEWQKGIQYNYYHCSRLILPVPLYRPKCRKKKPNYRIEERNFGNTKTRLFLLWSYDFNSVLKLNDSCINNQLMGDSEKTRI